MKDFMLNGLGKEWRWVADTKEEATLMMIEEVCGAKTIEEYEEYCKSTGVDPKIEWVEVDFVDGVDE